MKKISNILFLVIVILFFYNIFKYYSSSINIININLNRSNIEFFLKNKISSLPILENDTNNILEFNSSFDEEIKNYQPRSFWNLLRFK